MNINKVEQYFSEKKIPAFRLKQVKRAFFVESLGSFDDLSTLPKELKKDLSDNLEWFSFKSSDIKHDSSTKTQKAILKLNDDQTIETVLIKSKTGYTACVSSQVGCQMNCTFCATGQGGFCRDLSAEEIVDQVVFWNNHLKKEGKRVGSIVFMGMGEPFMNWIEVKKALNTMIDSDSLNIGQRHVSVSTCGIANKIREFAESFPQANLAISLHSANNQTRNDLMPVNQMHTLRKLMEQCINYVESTKRKLFFEYTFIDGVNDSNKEVSDLIDLIKQHYLFHLNIIPYNKTSALFSPTHAKRLSQIVEQLEKNRISYTVRKSAGADVSAACGQLSRPGKQPPPSFPRRRESKK